MVVGSVELRFPLVQNTAYGLLFADAGNAWLRVRDTDPFDLKRSLGLGVRVATPILGLIGFDFGYGFDNVDAEDVRKGRWRSHFQFGLLGF
jgi:outer membrane protein insertion porin family